MDDRRSIAGPGSQDYPPSGGSRSTDGRWAGTHHSKTGGWRTTVAAPRFPLISLSLRNPGVYGQRETGGRPLFLVFLGSCATRALPTSIGGTRLAAARRSFLIAADFMIVYASLIDSR